MEKIIELIGVKKVFKGNELFSDVNLQIEKGTIVGFKGRNGVGKSVLFKMISGLYMPDEGSIYVRGKKIGEDIDYPSNMGIMIDTPSFIEVLSGYENLLMLAEINGIISGDRIKEEMVKFGLDANSKKSVKNYSLGMRAKLGIIQATMEGQDIIVLDEPFNALDEKSCEYVYALIKTLKAKGATILLTSHNQSDLDELCDIQYLLPTFTASN
ncbi:MAG: ABC transporter ATP-binding protein [Lachnospiraceae bacterium]|nr:ABC transporter ATP-binding protein [Lachnospiraceae bacterium]